MPRWRGLRLVAAAGSTVRLVCAPAMSTRHPGGRILLGRFLPGPHLMPAASFDNVQERGEPRVFSPHAASRFETAVFASDHFQLLLCLGMIITSTQSHLLIQKYR
jgi:hypothetical protein